MNLHSIVAPIISAVNPNVPATLQKSAGYQTMADGTQSPIYEDAQSVTAQIQAMTGGDLRQVEGLNLNGTLRKIYLYGHANATVRVSQKGGDLLTIATPTNTYIYLINQVMEQWDASGWCACCATLQNGA